MNRLKDWLLKNEIGFYVLIALLYCTYTCLYVFSDNFRWMFGLAFGSVWGNFEDFQQMFPVHYYWLFIISIPFRIAIAAYFIYLFNRISTKMTMVPFKEIRHVDIREILFKELKIVATSFIFYLVIYLFINLIYPKPSYSYKILQLLVSRGFIVQLFLQIFLNVFARRQLILSYLKKYLFEPVLPYNIAILRILFFTYMAFTYLQFQEGSNAVIGLEHKSPLPFIGWLIHIIPVNSSLYSAFAYVGVVACIFIIMGFKTRWFLIINAVCCLYVIATPNFFGKLWHHQLIIWVSWFFAFSRCYDVYSIDALVKKVPLVKRSDYCFPVRFIWLQFGIIYFWAGYYKLWDSGFDWALSHSMVNQVQLEWMQNYDTVPYFRIDHYPFLLYSGGIFVILFELSYLLFVLKKKWRWIAFAGGIAMHSLIGIFLYISFFARLWLLYFFYVDFNIFYKKQKASVGTEIASVHSRKALYFGVFILSMNCLAGMFNIDSYPFSAYPKYSALIPGKIKIIRFDCGDGTDVHLTGKQNNFRWESYGWLEHGLIEDFEQGKDVNKKIEDYWEIWTQNNTQLRNKDSVKVFVDIRPVSPEGRDNLKTIGYICTFVPKK